MSTKGDGVREEAAARPTAVASFSGNVSNNNAMPENSIDAAGAHQGKPEVRSTISRRSEVHAARGRGGTPQPMRLPKRPDLAATPRMRGQPKLPSNRRRSLALHPSQPAQRLLAAFPAHHFARLQRAAHRRALGMSKNLATIGLVELDATHAGRLSAGHAGDGRTDGRRDAAGGAVRTALHTADCLVTCPQALGKIQGLPAQAFR